MSDSTNATPRSAVKVLQLIAFLALTALLLGTFGGWLRSTGATRLSWSLTPAAFSIALLVLSLLMAWTFTRRPQTWLLSVLLALLVINLLSAGDLDAVDLSHTPAYVLVLSAIVLLMSYWHGRRRLGRRLSRAMLAGGVIAVLILAGGAALIGGNSAFGGTLVFLRAPSPDARWLVVGVQFEGGAAWNGTTLVVVRRDVAGAFREQMVMYDNSDDLGNPRVRWLGPSTLSVNGRSMSLAGS